MSSKPSRSNCSFRKFATTRRFVPASEALSAWPSPRVETIIPNGRATIEVSATLKRLNGSEFRADLKTSDRGRRDRLTALLRDRLQSGRLGTMRAQHHALAPHQIRVALAFCDPSRPVSLTDDRDPRSDARPNLLVDWQPGLGRHLQAYREGVWNTGSREGVGRDSICEADHWNVQRCILGDVHCRRITLEHFVLNGAPRDGIAVHVLS